MATNEQIVSKLISNVLSVVPLRPKDQEKASQDVADQVLMDVEHAEPYTLRAILDVLGEETMEGAEIDLSEGWEKVREQLCFFLLLRAVEREMDRRFILQREHETRMMQEYAERWGYKVEAI